MRRRAIGKSSTSSVYVGLDVHKDSIAVAAAGRDGEVRHIGRIGGDLASLDKALRKLVSRGAPLHIVYEAGPCGFVIWRHLHAHALHCEVVVQSLRRMCSSMDKSKAVTAAAHKLARLIYTMLTKGQEYTDQGQDYYEERCCQRVLRALSQRATKMGHTDGTH